MVELPELMTGTRIEWFLFVFILSLQWSIFQFSVFANQHLFYFH